MDTLVNENPKIRGTFSEHCSKGFFVGTAFENYRSWIMWMKDTRATQISATVFHKNKYTTNPYIPPKDRFTAAVGKLADTPKGRMPPHPSEKSSRNWSASGPSSTTIRHRRLRPTRPGYSPIRLHPPHRTHPTYIPARVAPTPAPLTNPLI